jgi:hypothetical protein
MPNTHGRSKDSVYNSWRAILRRSKELAIPLCVRWRKFTEFIKDMGEPPPGTSLCMRNINRGYMPANCFWAPRSEQIRKTRRVRLIKFDGEEMCVAAWEEKLGFPPRLITNRLRIGWSEERALTTPCASSQKRVRTKRIHCKQGHKLVGKNVVIRRGYKTCRECARVSARKSTDKRKAERKKAP